MASTPQPGPTPEAAARTTNDSPGHDAQTIGTAGPGSNQAPDDPQLQPARSQDPESQGLPANANAVWIVTERWFDRYSPGHAPGAFQIVGVFTTLKDANSAAQKSATRVTNEVRGSLDFPESGTTVTGNYGRICIPLGNPESNGPLCLISVERHTLVQEFQQGAWREVLAVPLIELTEDGGRLPLSYPLRMPDYEANKYLRRFTRKVIGEEPVASDPGWESDGTAVNDQQDP